VRYRFVREYAPQFPVAALCRVMQVAKSGYYAWRRRAESRRAHANRALTAQIKAAHERSRKTYGRRRIHAQLRQEGLLCSRHRVARLMRQEGLRGRRRRAFRATTDSRHGLPTAPNLLVLSAAEGLARTDPTGRTRNFTATAPNQVWVSDITYLPCAEGWEYLATVMDLYNRQIVGWAMQSTLERSLTLRALAMAIRQRGPVPGLIHHSDRGVQYACGDYQAVLAAQGIRPSMSRKGDCWDNAPQESFFGTLKGELALHDLRLPRAEVRRNVFEYIEVFYNRQRLHSSLGYLSPVAFEQRFAAQVA